MCIPKEDKQKIIEEIPEVPAEDPVQQTTVIVDEDDDTWDYDLFRKLQNFLRTRRVRQI